MTAADGTYAAPGWRTTDDAELTPGDEALLDAAAGARANAYAPYSGFAVGAALLTADGRVVVGCNVENAAYPAGICAERTAVAAAVAGGARQHVAIAVVGSGPGPTTPCGMCRQVLNEMSPDLRVLCAGSDRRVSAHRLESLLPHSFGPARLAEAPRDEALPGSAGSPPGPAQ